MLDNNSMWVDPTYANEPLEGLRDSYIEWVRTRENPVSPETAQKYANTIDSFIRSLREDGKPLTLNSVNPKAVIRWISWQRERGLSEDGIASRLSALKAFTHQYLYGFLELTTRDPLQKIKRIQPPERSIPELTEEQQRRIIECFNRGTYEDVRNRAMMAVFIATGLRLSAVLSMDLNHLNRNTGEIPVLTKGNRWHLVRLSPGALKELKNYLKRRPKSKVRTEEHDPLWLKGDGTALRRWGVQSIFRRLRDRAGIPNLHAHLLRHNYAKKAARAGAGRSELQDVLAHRNPSMTLRYLGDVAKEIAARNMVRYSPLK